MALENRYAEALEELKDRRRIWREKPQIRLVYERWARRMKPFLPTQGALLEVGGGSGLTEDLWPEAIRCDIIPAPWHDFAADCMRLPAADSSLGAILAFDLLHHVADPHAFLREAARVLRPGGRVLLLEPYITPVSRLGYMAHHEDVYFGGYHRGVERGEKKADPWEGNLALANLVFGRQAKQWDKQQPDLQIIHKQYLSFFDFQLAMGFKPYCHVPMSIFKMLVRLDDLLGFAMALIGFRVFVVLEKRSA